MERKGGGGRIREWELKLTALTAICEKLKRIKLALHRSIFKLGFPIKVLGTIECILFCLECIYEQYKRTNGLLNYSCGKTQRGKEDLSAGLKEARRTIFYRDFHY